MLENRTSTRRRMRAAVTATKLAGGGGMQRRRGRSPDPGERERRSAPKKTAVVRKEWSPPFVVKISLSSSRACLDKALRYSSQGEKLNKEDDWTTFLCCCCCCCRRYARDGRSRRRSARSFRSALALRTRWIERTRCGRRRRRPARSATTACGSAMLAGNAASRSTAPIARSVVRKTHVFAIPFYAKNDRFTKTRSGQT